MYHLVSAVVLGFTTSIFTEGRIWAASPPCYIAVYFMTIGVLASYFKPSCRMWLALPADDRLA